MDHTIQDPVGPKNTDNDENDPSSDSGYSSQVSATPPSDVSKELAAPEFSGRAVPPLLALVRPSWFTYDIPAEVSNRMVSKFNDICAQIEAPLDTHLGKRSSKYRRIAIRLMILGPSRQESRPCIVVFCPEKQRTKIRKFFDRDSLRALCQPDDDASPSFEVIVCGSPPVPKGEEGDLEVMSDAYDPARTTLCGTPIHLVKSGQERARATLGGLIQVHAVSGEVGVFGITAGHILFDSHPDLWDEASEGSDGEDTDDSDGGDFFDLAPSSTSTLRHDSQAGFKLSGVSTALACPDTSRHTTSGDDQLERRGEKLGNVFQVQDLASSRANEGSDGKTVSRCYDWALIELPNSMCKPNRLHSSPNTPSGDMVLGSLPDDSPVSQQRVVMATCTGSSKPKLGFLSNMPCRIALGPCSGFVMAYILRLDDETEIQHGSSGTWVVNQNTLNVYGHIVATDDFGDGYVIPMTETLEDIRTALGAPLARLPTDVDVTLFKYAGSETPSGIFRGTSGYYIDPPLAMLDNLKTGSEDKKASSTTVLTPPHHSLLQPSTKYALKSALYSAYVSMDPSPYNEGDSITSDVSEVFSDGSDDETPPSET